MTSRVPVIQEPRLIQKAVGWASGVCIGDYNNDGFEDIFCTYFGQNRLYRNNGDGTFTDVTMTVEKAIYGETVLPAKIIVSSAGIKEIEK